MDADEHEQQAGGADHEQRRLRARRKDRPGHEQRAVSDHGQDGVPEPVLEDRLVLALPVGAPDDDHGIEGAEHPARAHAEPRGAHRAPRDGEDRGHEQGGAEVDDVRGAEGRDRFAATA